jgi:outer membrane lipoprotein SlyB
MNKNTLIARATLALALAGCAGAALADVRSYPHEHDRDRYDRRYDNDRDRYDRDRYDRRDRDYRYDVDNNPRYDRGYRQEVGRVVAIEARYGGYHQRNRGRDDGVEGALIGAIIGGLVGNQVGGGSGRDAATVAGAIAGGVAGRNIDRNDRDGRSYRHNRRRGEPDAYAISVELRSGRVVTVVQPRSDGRFTVGERVRVIERGGRARVEDL